MSIHPCRKHITHQGTMESATFCLHWMYGSCYPFLKDLEQSNLNIQCHLNIQWKTSVQQEFLSPWWKTTWHCKMQKCHIPMPWLLCRKMCIDAGYPRNVKTCSSGFHLLTAQHASGNLTYVSHTGFPAGLQNIEQETLAHPVSSGHTAGWDLATAHIASFPEAPTLQALQEQQVWCFQIWTKMERWPLFLLLPPTQKWAMPTC